MTADISDYTNRLTNYHRHRPKFKATVEATLQPFVDAYNFLSVLPQYFDIDRGNPPDPFAFGAQLDILGEHVNLSRKIRVPIRAPWFTLGDPTRGFGTGIWKQPYDPGTYLTDLDDENYRRLLKARIRANHWDGTASQAKSIMLSYFNDPSYTLMVQDRQNMSVIYAIAGRIPSTVDLEIFDGEYLPLRSAGVNTIRLVTTVNNAPLFGFGLDNDAVAGFGRGAIGAPPSVVIDMQLPSAPPSTAHVTPTGVRLTEIADHATIVGSVV